MENYESVSFELQIEKAVDENGLRVIYMRAHNELEDLQHEVIATEALKESEDYFLQNGYLDWHHLTERKQAPDPQDIIGYPLETRFNGKEVYVRAALHAGDKLADAVWAGLNCSPPKRYRASIAGKRIKTFQKANGVYTTKLIWTSVAITPSPVNTGDTSVSTSDTFSAFLKALASSADTDLAKVKGGQALSGVEKQEKPARIIVGSCEQWCDETGAFKNGLQQIDIVTYVTRYLGLEGEKAKNACRTLWRTYRPGRSAKGRSNAKARE